MSESVKSAIEELQAILDTPTAFDDSIKDVNERYEFCNALSILRSFEEEHKKSGLTVEGARQAIKRKTEVRYDEEGWSNEESIVPHPKPERE